MTWCEEDGQTNCVKRRRNMGGMGEELGEKEERKVRGRAKKREGERREVREK